MMIYTEQDIEEAISNVKNKQYAPTIREYRGYIVLAQDEKDFTVKCSRINQGDRKGFYTIERALSKH